MSIRNLFTRQNSRRTFLKSAVGSAFLPFLESIPGIQSAQATLGRPTRLLIVNSLHGVARSRRHSDWVQEETGLLGDLKQILQPFEPYKNHLIAVTGTDVQSADYHRSSVDSGIGHEYATPCTLTGDHQGASIDYLISESLGNITPHKRSLLEVTGGWNEAISFDHLHRPLNMFESTQAAYDTFFNNNIQAWSTNNVQNQFDALFSQLNSEFSSLRLNISNDDRIRLDGHISALEDFRHQITLELEGSTVGCSRPQIPSEGFAGNGSGTERKLYETLNLVGHIFSCDISRVATIQIHGIQSGEFYRWLLPNYGTNHHLISHFSSTKDNADPEEAKRALSTIRTWHAQQIKRFLDLISTMQDGTQDTVLDNTILLWTTEVSDPDSHSCSDMPFLIIAGKNTGLRQGGYHLRFEGRSHNDLLSSIAKAMNTPLQQGNGDEQYYVGRRELNQDPLDIFA